MTRCLLFIAFLVGCARTTYLGTPLPRSCERSLGTCEFELRLRVHADSDVPARASLTAYVASVAERLARVSMLERAPKIVIVESHTAGVIGDTIAFGRKMLVKLGSEAELAAILAHEIVHLEGGLVEMNMENGIDDEQMRVLESIADERAVLLLERAGYPSFAAYDALKAGLGALDEDNRHPPGDERLRRIATLVDWKSRHDDGRARFIAAIAGEVLDIDYAYGGPVGRRLVFPRSLVAVGLPAGVKLVDVWSSLHGSHDASKREYVAYSIGPAAGAELAAHLRERRAVTTSVGTVHVGTAPAAMPRDLPSLERMLAIARANRWAFDTTDSIAVLVREDEAIVLRVSGNGSAKALDAWVRLLERPTKAERAEAVSARIVPKPVPRAGTALDLGETCLDPRSVHLYENPQRMFAKGDLLKCTDRRMQ